MPDFRIFFNRRSEAPQVWSVDQGDQSTEINVKQFRLYRCNADSHWDPSVKVNPDTPSAWLTVSHAVMRVEDGIAKFFHDPTWRVPKIAFSETPEQREARLERETNTRLNELP